MPCATRSLEETPAQEEEDRTGIAEGEAVHYGGGAAQS